MFNSLKTNVIFLVIDILASAANLIFWLLYRYNLGLILAIVGFVNMFIMLLLVFWDIHRIQKQLKSIITEKESIIKDCFSECCNKERENERLNEIIKSYQQPVSAHLVKNSRTHGKTLEFIKAAEQETLNRFTEYIKAKLSAIYKERVSEKSESDFKLGASLLLVAQGEIEKAKGEFLTPVKEEI